MTTYIALLRGINVGGHRVKMERLRELFGEMGLANVRSFIQSGNIFFESENSDRTALVARIEARLLDALGYAVPTLLRTRQELQSSLCPNPFAGVEVAPDTRLLIVFTSEPLSGEQPLPARSPNGAIEIVGATSGEVFVVYRLSDGKPPNVEAFLKRAFGKGASTTTRFYDTTLKMLQAVQGR